MEKSSSKSIYIIIGAVLLVVAIPVFIALSGFLGGMFYWSQGTVN